jgi:hypothetical protein
MQIDSKGSCNIYYIENGICKTGILENPDLYSKPIGSSVTLVSVKVIESIADESGGVLVRPGTLILT